METNKQNTRKKKPIMYKHDVIKRRLILANAAVIISVKRVGKYGKKKKK